MTVTHETQPETAPAEPKRKKAKKPAPTAAPEATTEQAATEQPATEPSPESGNEDQPKTKQRESKPAKSKAKKPAKGPAPDLTLQHLADLYIEHLTASGKTTGTAVSYQIELDRAVKILGADTKVNALTPKDVYRFYNAGPVILLRSGQPKSKLSVDKTRRVLRLALVWAAERKWIEKAPLPDTETK